MRLWLTAFLLAVLWGCLLAAPPEGPSRPSPSGRLSGVEQLSGEEGREASPSESTTTLGRVAKILAGIGDTIQVKEMIIGGDSVTIRLSNDSVITFTEIREKPAGHEGGDIFRMGEDVVVDADQTIDGDIVVLGGDAVIKGTVEGGVFTLGGDIYVPSTGLIKKGAIALSGKIKREPGGRIQGVWKGMNSGARRVRSRGSTFRTMGLVFLIIYLGWLVLTATCSSLLGTQVRAVALAVRSKPWKSLFMGYAVYLLAFVAMAVLSITIIGMPLGLLGVPLVLFGGMLLSSTALFSLAGQLISKQGELSFRTFLHGVWLVAGVPGLLFVLQAITNSSVITVFSCVAIAFFIFIILPLGLGAVFFTRFGTRSITKTTAIPVNSQS